MSEIEEELVYQSESTRVTRVRAADGSGSTIHKKRLGPDAAKRIHHELAILERLTGVDGVLQPLSTDAVTLVFPDLGGVSLAAAGKPGLSELLELAPALATTLAEVHAKGVTHKDVNPANVVLADGRPVLIDFDLATTFAEELPGFTHQREIVGTLPYLPPEQSGRTGWAVDQRADLYGLGATLYELATGRPPFGTGDALRLIHDHLTRVPTPPAEVDPKVPAAFSEIIMRLLQKEPDQRYQSARGLAFDLARLRYGDGSPFALGERDFPLRLAPPSRLVGRDQQVAALAGAFSQVRQDGYGRAGAKNTGLVLVSGAPGVGKTRLVDELRPLVTATGGWFVSGKFDQHRRDEDTNAVRQAMQGIGRLLLAEPEATLDAVRQRLRRVLGAQAGLLAAVSSEMSTALSLSPTTPSSDPNTARAQLAQVGVELLRTLASPTRPIVMVIDDIQWGGPTPIGFIDTLAGEAVVPGLLLVVAYRPAEVDQAHPFAAILARWVRQRLAPTRLELAPLPQDDLSKLLAELLRLAPAQATALAAQIEPQTGGNPFDTVELVNVLRRDGVLALGADGWTWDAEALRRSVTRGDVVELLSIRIDGLAAPTRTLLEVMACVGGQVDLKLLREAADLPDDDAVEEGLRPALEEGLLVMENESGTVRFVHDRVQQAAFARLTGQHLVDLQLAIARRVAAVPGLEAIAVAQYLPVLSALTDADPGERERVAALCRKAAHQARLMSNYPGVERYLAAEEQLTGRTVRLATERHAALNALGRLTDADELFDWLTEQPIPAAELADAAGAQMSSLTNRGRAPEALVLGHRLLRELGMTMPEGDAFWPAIAAGLAHARAWAAEGDAESDLRRPEVTDPWVLVVAKLFQRLAPPAFFADPHRTIAWLVVESIRLWDEHGPAAPLLSPISHLGLVAPAVDDDYQIGHRVMQRVLEVGEARGYEPGTSGARFLYAVCAGPWVESAEETLAQVNRAHEGLVHGGDLTNAAYTYLVSLFQTLECAPTLDDLRAEVKAGLEFCHRLGNDQATSSYYPYNTFVDVLGGAEFPVEDPHPSGAALFHITRGLAAALLGDADLLAEHSVNAMATVRFLGASPAVLLANVLRSLALVASGSPGGPAASRSLTLSDADLAELDACQQWIAARAADAPGNFAHLLHLVEAERAAAAGLITPATSAYDAAMREAATRSRPWHQAFITERAGRFQLACDREHTGHLLLGEARARYAAWGATAKVARLDAEFPTLDRRVAERGSTALPLTGASISLSSSTIDLLGVLQATQALSSETNLQRLDRIVAEVLGAMTGATAVHVVLWDEDWQRWSLPPSDAKTPGMPLQEAGALALIPNSAVRYAERSDGLLLVEDATKDDRFRRDPYVAALERCSLLVMPIRNRGALLAMLVLVNSLSQGAFSAERLEGVQLIAGQLAVSFDNALVYASLERKVEERTAELAEVNRRLEQLSVTDELTGLANRRRLTETLESEWRRGRRSKDPLALAMLDIDHFKRYNDHYGHPGGDECLRQVALELGAQVRTTDLAARYGGEEFCLVMPNTDTDNAVLAAERVGKAIAALALPHAGSDHGFVTVSMGVASMVPSPDDPVQVLVDAADAKLYQAKTNGRNQVAS